VSHKHFCVAGVGVSATAAAVVGGEWFIWLPSSPPDHDGPEEVIRTRPGSRFFRDYLPDTTGKFTQDDLSASCAVILLARGSRQRQGWL